ncbi:unnamed protein product [Pleuronectes platessa]|uniref:Uncharacterized protein n=1 Tax=Pleuronectes platessa TaxID=8262 RepID=A0A9N7Z7B0_PLEPL|nr:unnamed protein product [Pleuronectes platessa]
MSRNSDNPPPPPPETFELQFGKLTQRRKWGLTHGPQSWQTTSGRSSVGSKTELIKLGLRAVIVFAAPLWSGCPNIYRALAALECRGRAGAESSSRGKPLLSSTSADSFPLGQSVNTDSARDVGTHGAKHENHALLKPTPGSELSLSTVDVIPCGKSRLQETAREFVSFPVVRLLQQLLNTTVEMNLIHLPELLEECRVSAMRQRPTNELRQVLPHDVMLRDKNLSMSFQVTDVS